MEHTKNQLHGLGEIERLSAVNKELIELLKDAKAIIKSHRLDSPPKSKRTYLMKQIETAIAKVESK
jgi:hypothetical protein